MKPVIPLKLELVTLELLNLLLDVLCPRPQLHEGLEGGLNAEDAWGNPTVQGGVVQLSASQPVSNSSDKEIERGWAFSTPRFERRAYETAFAFS